MPNKIPVMQVDSTNMHRDFRVGNFSLICDIHLCSETNPYSFAGLITQA